MLDLLALLKDDPSPYVRGSVANDLNDIGKDHPDVLVATCRRWWPKASEERRWMIRHALRSAVKRGDRAALDVLGFGGAEAAEVDRVRSSPAGRASATLSECRSRSGTLGCAEPRSTSTFACSS